MHYGLEQENLSNGIWLGRRRGAYLGLAKGSNHSPNSKEYEQKVAIVLDIVILMGLFLLVLHYVIIISLIL